MPAPCAISAKQNRHLTALPTANGLHTMMLSTGGQRAALADTAPTNTEIMRLRRLHGKMHLQRNTPVLIPVPPAPTARPRCRTILSPAPHGRAQMIQSTAERTAVPAVTLALKPWYITLLMAHGLPNQPPSISGQKAVPAAIPLWKLLPIPPLILHGQVFPRSSTSAPTVVPVVTP